MGEQNGLKATLVTSPAKRELVWRGEPDERFPVPTPGRFSGEVISAEDLRDVAGRLIGKRTAFKHLASVEIDYLWKRKGGSRAGMPILGACQRVSGIWQAFTEATWVVWLAADNCASFTNWLIQCNLTHQLLHAGEGEGGEPAVVGHDFEGFAKELEWCGAWTEGLTVATRAVSQLQLPWQTALPVEESLPEVEKLTTPIAALTAVPVEQPMLVGVEK